MKKNKTLKLAQIYGQLLMRVLGGGCIFLASAAALHAACNIQPFTASHLVLMPSQGDNTNTAFTMQCDQPYSIRFNNLNNSNGNNGMLKYLNHSIRTELHVESQDGRLSWNTAAAQPARIKNRYVVTVRVADRISPLLPAGEYKDQLSVYIEY